MVSLKGGAAVAVQMTSARGLVGDAYLARKQLIDPPSLAVFSFVALAPGEETLVPLTFGSQELPQNANVQRFIPELQVSDEFETVPPAPASSVTVTQGAGPPMKLSVTADAGTRPRNVSVRLDQDQPFWSFGDTLTKNSYTLPDIAKQINAYLDKAKPGPAGITLKFLVKSDSAGRVRIRATQNVFKRLQTQSWPNDLDQTIRTDRNLQLVFGQRYELPLDALPASARPSAIRVDLGGTFGPERMLGIVRPHAGHDFATLSSDYALAQGFVLDKAVKAVGVAGAFLTDGDAEIYVELQPDASGSPATGAPLAKSNLTLKAPAADASPWAYAELGAPVDLAAATAYWIVIKGVHGNVRLGVESDADTYLTHLVVNRGGKLWKAFDRRGAQAASLVRVVYLPEPDNQSAAIRVGIDEDLWQSVDPGASPSGAAFEMGGAGGAHPPSATVIVESQARGALTLANLVQEY